MMKQRTTFSDIVIQGRIIPLKNEHNGTNTQEEGLHKAKYERRTAQG